MDRGRDGSRRAQSSVIGIVLIIGLTLAAASAVVVFGSDAIDDGRQQSRIGQAEQAMTQFDSRTAQVALGDSDVQTIPMGQGRGTYRVNETAGRIKLYHEDWNGTNTTSDEHIYEANLGALVYESGGTTIAYQGGGVWRHDEGGGSTMVSPPELHNRKATLTLPVVQVKGTDVASGQPRATVRSVTSGKPIFPDLEGETTSLNEQYNDSDEHYYVNPVQEGNMTVEIESEYCEAWRSYFVSRTEGRVDDCEDGAVTAQIVALGTQGAFDIGDGSGISVRGVDSLEEFVIRIDQNEQKGASTFNSLDWEMSTETDDEEFGIQFKGYQTAKCGDSVEGIVYYRNDTVNQSWNNMTAFPLDGPNCPDHKDPLHLEVDLLNDSIYMNQQADPVTIGGTEYNSSNPPSIGTLVTYYFEKIEDMDLAIREGNQAKISDTSVGDMEYEGTGQVVTFLHVTENEVKVDFD